MAETAGGQTQDKPTHTTNEKMYNQPEAAALVSRHTPYTFNPGSKNGP